MRDNELKAKIEKYETYLNETLKRDLKVCLEERDKVYSEQAEYLALRNSINAIKSADLKAGEPLKTQVDLGCNFYCNARIADPSKIFVAVGLGFHVEMTLDEALQFIDKKDKQLTERTDELTKQAAFIKANVKLVIGGLRELQNIRPDTQKPQRDIFA